MSRYGKQYIEELCYVPDRFAAATLVRAHATAIVADLAHVSTPATHLESIVRANALARQLESDFDGPEHPWRELLAREGYPILRLRHKRHRAQRITP